MGAEGAGRSKERGPPYDRNDNGRACFVKQNGREIIVPAAGSVALLSNHFQHTICPTRDCQGLFCTHNYCKAHSLLAGINHYRDVPVACSLELCGTQCHCLAYFPTCNVLDTSGAKVWPICGPTQPRSPTLPSKSPTRTRPWKTMYRRDRCAPSIPSHANHPVMPPRQLMSLPLCSFEALLCADPTPLRSPH